MSQFPASRYQRAGATPNQIRVLERQFEQMPAAGQASELARIAQISDYQLRADLPGLPNDSIPEPVSAALPSIPAPVEDPVTDEDPDVSAPENGSDAGQAE